MKKRMLALLLVAALLLSLVPVIAISVNAEGEDKHTDHTGWTKWTDKTKLPTAVGKYYLDVDVTLSAAWTAPAGHVQLCLNGHTISKTGTTRIITLNAGRELSVYDCAESYNALGEYVGGKIVGGSNANNGMIIVARATTTAKHAQLNLYGGRLCGNRPTKTGLSGGAVYMQTGQKNKPGGVFNMYGGEIYDCEAQYGGAMSVPGEAAANRGDTPAAFHMYGGMIHGNKATTGIIYATNDSIIDIQGGQFVNNTASTGSAIFAQNDNTVNLKDVEITGNTATSTDARGNGAAIHLRGATTRLTLSGKVTVADNTNAAGADITINSDDGKDIETVYVDGLTGGKVYFAVMDKVATGASDVVAFAGSNTAYTDGTLVLVDGSKQKSVLLVNGEFVFEGDPGAVVHTHKMGTEEVSFKAWTKKDSLPTSGNWFLMENVTLTDAATVTEDLNLCLNGKTVTQTTAGKRILNVGNASTANTVALTDCGTTGTLTGGTATYGACVSIRHKATFNLYGGKLTGNDKTGSGAEGTVYMQGNTPCGNTFNMYGGEISNNSSRVGGAVSVGAPAATVTNIPTVNLYGGKITGNTAQENGGAVNLSGNAKVFVGDVEISGNSAKKGGGIYVSQDATQITFSGAPLVQDNIAAGKPNNVYLNGKAVITLGALQENAKVGVTAGTIGRAISATTDKDYTKNILSDSVSKMISYKEKALWIEEYSDHQHCICDGVEGDCDHTSQMWLAWGDEAAEATTLPTSSGYYYLVDDVTLTATAMSGANQNIHLCLNGHTVTAPENDRHFVVSNGTTYSVTDCSAEVGGFTGGNRTFGGVVNINAGGTLNLYAGRMWENISPNSEGGAIYLQAGRNALSGGVLNLYGGIVENNTALYGGGIRAAGLNAGGTGVPSTVNIYGGEIRNNSSVNMVTTNAEGKEVTTNGHGGGIDVQTGSVLNLYGGIISGNSAQYNGGGIFLANSVFNMEGGTITGNKAANYGGGFFDSIGVVTLKEGTISNNQAVARGGAFVANGSVMDIYKVTITGNSSKEGGVTYMNQASKKANGVTTIYPAKVTVHDGAVVTGNSATANTGGFLVANPDVQLIIAGGEITKNTAANGGAIMIWKGATVTVKGGKIANNNVGLGIGGAVYASNDSTFVMEGGTISGNSARLGGGVYGDRAVLNLNGGSISGNYVKIKYTWKDGKEVKSGGQGAGVYIQGSTLNIRGTAINYNRAESNGGGVVMGQQSVKVNGVQTKYLPKVTMTGGSISYNYSGAAAGGMLVQSSGTVTNIYGGSIVGNESKSHGGGIYVSTKATLNMTGGLVSNNKSGNLGGGIFVSQGAANVSNATFKSNTAVANAAQLLISGADAVFVGKNCKFLEGESKSGGVAVVQSRAHATFENCDFGNNKATAGAGGAVYISTRSFGTLTGCKFYNNEATNNAGALMLSNNAEVTVTDCDFTENSSEILGGATYVSPAATLTINSSSFTKCTSAGRGGAIACRGNIFLNDSVIENCTAATEGGAIATDVNTMGGSGIMRGLVMDGTVVRNNTAGGKGGGIYGWKGCRLELYNSEFTGNVSPEDGGAIWAYEDLELHNTKITGNRSGGEGYAVYMNDANFDGQSYMASKNKLSGNTIIRDNEGKDLFMGPDVVFAITGEGLGQDAYIELVLAEGYVTHQIQGAFHYEGGNQVYTVTYGNRSIIEPEYDPNLVPQEETTDQASKGEEADKSDIWLYVGVGAVALIVLATVAVLILKKKKTPEATKE